MMRKGSVFFVLINTLAEVSKCSKTVAAFLSWKFLRRHMKGTKSVLPAAGPKSSRRFPVHQSLH